MGTDTQDMVCTLLNILVCLTGFHSTISISLAHQEDAPWWRSLQLSGDPSRRDLRGDKDAFWAVRGKRSASSEPAEISLEDTMETTYQYLKLIHHMIQEYAEIEDMIEQTLPHQQSKRFMKPNGLFSMPTKKGFSKPNGLFTTLSTGKRAIVKPNGLFTAMPGKRTLKPNGLFTSMIKRPLKPNGLFSISGKRSGMEGIEGQPIKRSPKPNGFFLLKRMLKPNGIFTAIKRSMLPVASFEDEYFNLDEPEEMFDELYDSMEEVEKKDDDSFWAVRGKKSDNDFWAVRGKRELESAEQTEDTTSKLPTTTLDSD